MNQNADVTLIGHISLDSILLPNRSLSFNAIGGSVTYASFATKRLGASPSIISKVGGDFPEAYRWLLEQEGIDIKYVSKLPMEHTTHFELKYSKDLSKRKLKLISKAPPISFEDVPAGLQSRVIHLGPIANEIALDLIEHLKNCCDVLSIDPQGLLRRFNKNGTATHRAKMDKQFLSWITIYKSSMDEILALTGSDDLKTAIKTIHDYGIETVIVTNGAKGAVLSVEGTRYNVDACPPRLFVDPTGAGDVFIGGFINEYIKQKDALWCACVGCAAASMVVEAIGPTYFGEKEEIYRRATFLYEKEIKQ